MQSGAPAAAPGAAASATQHGVIKFFNAKKGFGFVTPDLDDVPFVVGRMGQPWTSGAAAAAAPRPPAAPDVFMHKSSLQPGTPRKDGQRVAYEYGLNQQGKQVAVSVRPSDCPPALHHREWIAADFSQLKSLHGEWFPVRYPDTYWKQACEKHLSLEGWSLFTLTSHTPGDSGRIVGCISAVIMDVDTCVGLNPGTITGADGEPALTCVYLKTLGVRDEARRGTNLRSSSPLPQGDAQHF